MSWTSYASYAESLSDQELARELVHWELLGLMSPLRRALIAEGERRTSASGR